MRKKRAAQKRQSYLLQAADAAFSSNPPSRTSVSSTASHRSALASSSDFTQQRGSTDRGSGASTGGRSQSSSREELLRSSAVFETAGLERLQQAVQGVSFPHTASHCASARSPKPQGCVEKRRASLSKSRKTSPSPGSKRAETAPAAGADPLSVLSGTWAPAEGGVGEEIPAGRNRDSYVNDIVHMYAEHSTAQQPRVVQQPSVSLTNIVAHYAMAEQTALNEGTDEEALSTAEPPTVGAAQEHSERLTHIVNLYMGANPSAVEQPPEKSGLTHIIKMYADEGTDVGPLARENSMQLSPGGGGAAQTGLQIPCSRARSLYTCASACG